MKAFIDHKSSELITVGFDPEFAREQMNLLGLERWAWIEDNDRAIPDSWEEIELLEDKGTLV
jgi:hypothetical protein